MTNVYQELQKLCQNKNCPSRTDKSKQAVEK